MATVYISPEQAAESLLPLLRAAVQGEVLRLELALQLAQDRLAPFERKYSLSSEEFMASMVAEDLEGGDDEYVVWAGEFELAQSLRNKLSHLRGIDYYGAPGLLR